jgi:mannose-6-phosphate isomerase-like protein (cupin superfamily)
MKGYIINLEEVALSNTDFRRVLYTAQNSQLVLMSLKPKEDIGEEIHHLDQFVRIEKGQGVAILNDIEHNISDGFGVVVPAGTKHNFINTSSDTDLKLYTLYSPPEHRDAVVRATKKEAMASEEHFDGQTTE